MVIKLLTGHKRKLAAKFIVGNLLLIVTYIKNKIKIRKAILRRFNTNFLYYFKYLSDKLHI